MSPTGTSIKFAKMKPRNKSLVGISLVIVGLMCACTSTIKPAKVQPNQASFDGTNQNSGLISHDKINHTGEVTPHWRDEYNGLIEVYKTRFIPPLQADYGLKPSITNGQWTATDESLVNKGKMLLWRRNNIK